ncbi:MAG: NAD(P)/FAD-dependent oxidoreductase [Microcystis aeruginosa Ma_AC_P_19900807_S299]|nr:MAG: NAD(P)/FAD-dependent oxidoreductase [Microcystis aeruginosa Ma_AC_P_19900807_S299]
MNKPITKICILGGGFGGLYTALDLSRLTAVKSCQWQITLVEPKDHFLFTPLLYELITGELQRWEIAPSYRQLLTGTQVNLKSQKASNIDLNNHRVYLENEEVIDYDYLVLAVGVRNRWPAIPGLADYGLTFRSLEDVEKLQTAIHELETQGKSSINLAIIGGGPNGVELACKVADRLGKKGKVHLVEKNEEILQNFPKSVRVASYRSLLAKNVSLYLNTGLKEVAANSITVFKDNTNEVIPIDLLLWTAGTQAQDWINDLDCQKTAQGKLLTRSSLQLIDYPEVFAVGDLAEIYPSKQVIPATAQAAYQAASVVAKNISAVIRKKSPQPYYYLHLGDMLTLGKQSALVSSFGINITGKLADIMRRFVYILRLPSKRHQLKVFQHWAKKILLRLRYSQVLSNTKSVEYRLHIRRGKRQKGE